MVLVGRAGGRGREERGVVGVGDLGARGGRGGRGSGVDGGQRSEDEKVERGLGAGETLGIKETEKTEEGDTIGGRTERMASTLDAPRVEKLMRQPGPS